MAQTKPTVLSARQIKCIEQEIDTIRCQATSALKWPPRPTISYKYKKTCLLNGDFKILPEDRGSGAGGYDIVEYPLIAEWEKKRDAHKVKIQAIEDTCHATLVSVILGDSTQALEALASLRAKLGV